MSPRSDGTATFGILATVGAEVLVGFNEVVEFGSVGVGAVLGHQLSFGRDVSQAVGATVTIHIAGHGVAVASVAVATDVAVVEAFVVETHGFSGVLTRSPGPASVEEHAVRRDIAAVAQLMDIGTVDAKGVGVVCRSDLVADTVSDVLAFSISVGSHQVETALEVLAQLTSDAVVVTVVLLVGVGNSIRSDGFVERVVDSFVLPDDSFTRFAGELDGAILNNAEFGDGNRGDVLVVDAFSSEFDVARDGDVEGQAALPTLRHTEVLVHDGGRLRSRQVASL